MVLLQDFGGITALVCMNKFHPEVGFVSDLERFMFLSWANKGETEADALVPQLAAEVCLSWRPLYPIIAD